MPLPTPSTTHLSFATIYEPAEDSFFLLDTLSSPAETAFLQSRFPSSAARSNTCLSPSPLIVEVGTGSGVIIAFLTANATHIFGREDVLTLGVDVNVDACAGTRETVRNAVSSSSREREEHRATGVFLDAVTGDLTSMLLRSSVDVLVFNPPYVPTEELPGLPGPMAEVSSGGGAEAGGNQLSKSKSKAELAQERFERESHLLALSYAGGEDGMQTTNRLLEMLPRVLSVRGVAYVLLCARNRPVEVLERIRGWECEEVGKRWRAEVCARMGGKGGWERLEIVRIWREEVG